MAKSKESQARAGSGPFGMRVCGVVLLSFAKTHPPHPPPSPRISFPLRSAPPHTYVCPFGTWISLSNVPAEDPDNPFADQRFEAYLGPEDAAQHLSHLHAVKSDYTGSGPYSQPPSGGVPLRVPPPLEMPSNQSRAWQ